MTSHERVMATTELHALGKFFGKKLEDDTVADYVDALDDLTLGALEHAIRTLKRDGRFMPKPRELRQAAHEATVSTRPPWRGTQIVTGEDGQPTAVYHCAVCQDLGWAPACGCSQAQMGTIETNGQCPTHPRVVNGVTYRQAMQPCGCRGGNPTYQAQRQRPQAAPVDRQRGAA